MTEVKIADIMFACENHELIHALKARGSSIVKQKWEKVKESEKKIQDLLTNDINKLTMPNSAFITFEEVEDVSLALKHSKKSPNLEILPGQPFGLFKKACEPTDVIWENRHFT